MSDIIWCDAEQNTDEWMVDRLGVITASCAELARARSNGLTKQQQAYVDAVRAGVADPVGLAGYKKAPSSDLIRRAIDGEKLPEVWSDGAMTYAMDLGRERLGGGRPQGGGSGFAARVGHEQETKAAAEYEAQTGNLTKQVGFAKTADGRFGASPDRLVIGERGAIEIKTMVSSSVLWDVFVDGDITAYRDQCLMQMWLLRLDWVDLCLWVPDLFILRVVRIERDESEMAALENDLMAFDILVERMRAGFAKALGLADATGFVAYTDGLDDAPEVVTVTTNEAEAAPAQQVLEPAF